MHVVLGATGHVGSAVADALLDRGEPVTVVTRDAQRAECFARRGATVAVADVRDAARLRDVLRGGRRAFLLMPPADPAGDAVAEERRTVAAIVRAVGGAGLERVVVQSTYGARDDEGIGDLGVLHELERGVAAQGVRATMLRAAYYMSNWDAALDTARAEGVVHTFLPPGLALPMVAPADVGRVAARLLTDDAAPDGIRHVEGPAPCSPADVARAFADALGRDVRAVGTPRAAWTGAFRALGFSAASAASYAAMTAATVDEPYVPSGDVERGATTLARYVEGVVGRG